MNPRACEDPCSKGKHNRPCYATSAKPFQNYALRIDYDIRPNFSLDNKTSTVQHSKFDRAD